MEQMNQYVKQFPDLMKGKTVMYVHGFGSSAQSGTVARLREVMPSARIVAHDLPLHPQEALNLLHATCDKEHPDLIIGTSMGGMYTEQLYGYDRILINPAFQIADTMQEHGMTGKQQYQNPRKDGIQEFYVDKALVKEYRTITEGNFAHADDPDEQHRVYGLFGDKDELVHTSGMFPYLHNIPFHGEHRMNDHSFMHSVVPVIRWIDDRQEKRERPIIYIGTETLWQQDGRVRPSAQKAVRQLIDVPAWGHTVITNQRHLLYGDYLIQGQCPARWPDHDHEPMATTIEFGSDTFKTWDDILVFFNRLGGQ